MLQKLPGSVFCGDIQETQVTVAVRVGQNDQASSNLRSWLVNYHKIQAAGVGFEKDFAALNKVTTHYAELKLPQAQLVLEAELQRSGERVQLVGLNLPLKMLSLAATVQKLCGVGRLPAAKIRQRLAQQDQLIAFAQRSRFPANRVEHHCFTAIEPDEKARLQIRAIGQEHVGRCDEIHPDKLGGTGTRYISLASRRTESSS